MGRVVKDMVVSGKTVSVINVVVVNIGRGWFGSTGHVSADHTGQSKEQRLSTNTTTPSTHIATDDPLLPASTSSFVLMVHSSVLTFNNKNDDSCSSRNNNKGFFWYVFSFWERTKAKRTERRCKMNGARPLLSTTDPTTTGTTRKTDDESTPKTDDAHTHNKNETRRRCGCRDFFLHPSRFFFAYVFFRGRA